MSFPRSRSIAIWCTSIVGLTILAWVELRGEISPPAKKATDDALLASPGERVATSSYPRELVDGGNVPPSKPKDPSPSESVESMHLRQAPADLQQAYAAVAESEMRNYVSRANDLAPTSSTSINDYLSFLIATRESRMRDLARQELLAGRAVLAFQGVKPIPDVNRLKVTYLGVSSFYGQQANLIVWIGPDRDHVDTQIAALSASIQEVAMTALSELVVTFNQQSREAREASLASFRSKGTLPGLSEDLRFVVGRRLRIDDATATLLSN